MKEEQRGNEEELQPNIQVKHLPLLLRPKQTCELFGIDLKALYKLEISGRLKSGQDWAKEGSAAVLARLR